MADPGILEGGGGGGKGPPKRQVHRNFQTSKMKTFGGIQGPVIFKLTNKNKPPRGG